MLSKRSRRRLFQGIRYWLSLALIAMLIGFAIEGLFGKSCEAPPSLTVAVLVGLVFALFCLNQLARASSYGVVWGNKRDVSRSKNPILFWMNVVLYLTIGVWCCNHLWELVSCAIGLSIKSGAQ